MVQSEKPEETAARSGTHGFKRDARGIIAGSIPAGARVIVLGAGGWFGRTYISLVAGLGIPLLLIGSYSRKVEVGGVEHEIVEWSEESVLLFRPTIVLDAAFLTRRYLEVLGHKEYLRKNMLLMKRVLWLAGLESVRRVVTISSGAVYSARDAGVDAPNLEPYGFLKQELESQLVTQASQTDTTLVVARAFSVSGGFVQFPEEYALSSFVRQALDSGLIRVEAPALVYRRYCSVSDFLAVGFGLSNTSGITQFDSGGDLVELADLARMVAEAVEGPVSVEAQPDRAAAGRSNYCSDNTEWEQALRETNLSALNLPQQISEVVGAFSEGPLS